MTRETANTTTIEHPIGATGSLEVKLADWDVAIVPGPDDVVRVRDAGGAPLRDDLEIDRGTGSLSIRQPTRFPGISFVLGSRQAGRRLLVEAPATARFNVDTASGDVATDRLRGDQRIRTASGDVRLEAASGDLATETVSGDVVVRIEGSAGLAVKTVSGDVSIEGGRVERLRLTTTSGDVRLTSDLSRGPHAIASVSGDVMLLSNNALRITAVTLTGDLSTDLPHTSQGGPGRRSIVIGDGATELQFRSVSGDLRVVDPTTAANGSLPPAPAPPLAPLAPEPPATSGSDSVAPTAVADEPDATRTARLEILRTLESGEIDVAEATTRLAALDGAGDD
jgi:hypothetical protein